MDRYQLVKLVEWAGEIKGRKRMQKVVFLLKCAGCPVEADYSLHHYGPYSADVAQLTDELVQVGLLEEASSPNQVGKQFFYNLSATAGAALRAFEASPAGDEALKQIASFEDLAKELLDRDLSELEYAATIAYFHDKGHNWDEAFQETCEFKRLKHEWPVAQSAFELAKSNFK